MLHMIKNHTNQYFFLQFLQNIYFYDNIINNLRDPLHLRTIFSRNVFCGATRPRLVPGIV